MRWRDEPGAKVIETLVAPGDVVVDIGANDGVHAYAYARLVRRSGHVFAFEPHPAQTRCLRRFAELENTTLQMIALSDHDGEAELRSPVLRGRAVRAMASLSRDTAADQDYEVVHVALRRLDDVLPSGAVPTFVKCDVEGHEHAVLLGAEATIRRARPLLLVEIEQRHRRDPVTETFELVEGWGYRTYALRDQRLIDRAELDIERLQAPLVRNPLANDVPPGYVHDFLFAPVERPLPPELTSP